MKPQEKLEERQEREGRDKYWSNVRSLERNNNLCITAPGRRLLGGCVEPLDLGLQGWLSASTSGPGRHHSALPFLSALPTDLTAMLAARAVLDGLGRRQQFTAMAIAVGWAVEREVMLRKMKATDRVLFGRLTKQVFDGFGEKHTGDYILIRMKREGHDVTPWAVADKVRVGTVMIELLATHTGLVEIKKGRGMKGQNYVEATESMMQWLNEAHEHYAELRPFYLPMIEPPAPYRGGQGGYITEVLGHKPLVRTHFTTKYQTIDYTMMPEVFDAMNAHAQTPWRINDRMLDVLDHIWDNNLNIAGVPPAEKHPYPNKPEDIDTHHESRKKYATEKARIMALNYSETSSRLSVAKIKQLAHEFQGQDLWFPVFLDFRGRLYCTPSYLSPQGRPISRSLLEFSEGKPMNQSGYRMLAIHGANVFGAGKIPLRDRVKWVEDRADIWRRIAADPFSDMTWADAPDPFPALAWAIEWGTFATAGWDHVSHFPVAMDASTQGLALIAMLTRDLELGEATNCLPLGVPQDLYSDVLADVMHRLETDDNPDALPWIYLEPDRALTKQICMTIPYGANKFTCIQQVVAWYDNKVRDRKFKPLPKPYRAASYMAGLIWESAHERAKVINPLMKWLDEVVSIMCSHGAEIRWTAPTGFEIIQAYTKQDTQVVKTILGKKVRKCNVNKPTKRVDMVASKRSMCANLIHSLDASIMVKAMNGAAKRGATAFSMIHDSFATHPASADALGTAAREAAASVFGQDLLSDFHKQLQAQVSEVLPEPPLLGEMDTSTVVDSDYFFS